MKIVQIALITVTALGAGISASYADAPTSQQQAEDLWVATGDPAIGRAAGLTESQIAQSRHLPYERVYLGD
jgi:2-keto-4-pentenoate hydratase